MKLLIMYFSSSSCKLYEYKLETLLIVSKYFLKMDAVHCLIFYLKQQFGDWTLPLCSGKEPAHLGPINRASTIINNCHRFLNILTVDCSMYFSWCYFSLQLFQ